MYFVVVTALLGFVLIDGLMSVITKDALSQGDTKALVFSFYRDLGAFPILLACARVVDGQKRLYVGDIPLFAALGVLGMFGTQFLYILGLEFVAADTATILNVSQVPLTTLIAVLVGQERLSVCKIVALLLCVGGSVCLCLLTPGSRSQGEDNWLGYICIPCACLCFSSYLVLQKRALIRYPPLSVTAWSYAFGAIFMGSTCIIAYAGQSVFMLRRQAWIAIAFGVIFNSVIKYAIASFVNVHAEATTIMAATTAVPVCTAVLAYMDPHEREDPFKARYLCFFPILLGVFMLRPQRQQFSLGRS